MRPAPPEGPVLRTLVGTWLPALANQRSEATEHMDARRS